MAHRRLSKSNVGLLVRRGKTKSKKRKLREIAGREIAAARRKAEKERKKKPPQRRIPTQTLEDVWRGKLY
jgi:hypothetical protein